MTTVQQLPLTPLTRAADSEPDGQHKAVMVMTLMRALQGVMEVEGELLRSLPFEWLRDIQAEKMALVDRYEQALRQLRGALNAPAGMTETDRAVVDAAVRDLAVAVRRNTARLAQARATLDEVAQAIDDSLTMMRDGTGLAPRPRLARG